MSSTAPPLLCNPMHPSQPLPSLNNSRPSPCASRLLLLLLALLPLQGLITSDKPGRVRGLQWTVNAIATMYYDKVRQTTRLPPAADLAPL